MFFVVPAAKWPRIGLKSRGVVAAGVPQGCASGPLLLVPCGCNGNTEMLGQGKTPATMPSTVVYRGVYVYEKMMTSIDVCRYWENDKPSLT